MKIALAGNPNCGKTTLYNAITGKNEHVGNWAGVTVEKKEGKIKDSLNSYKDDLTVIDLPGAYSISPYTCEECITKNFITNENPDVIINIVDSTNLSRSLFFTTQLLELGIPVVVALNKIDLNIKKDNKINSLKLSKILNTPVVETISVKANNNGLKELITETENLHKLKSQKLPTCKNSSKSSLTKIPTFTSDKKRYDFVNKIVLEVENRKNSSSKQTKQDTLDRILAHKWIGIPIFVAVIWFIFSISQSWVGPWFADLLVGWIDSFYEFLQVQIGDKAHPVVRSLLFDGIIGGVGAVVGFLPLIMVLFFFLALLEDCGYMARVAVILDKYFKKIGLSGRSVIPMVIGTGCAIPGVMATRTIKNERQRKTTAMLTPFMPCGAKLPIIALFAGVFFSDKAWVGTSMYFLGILIILISALIIRKITGDTSKSYFIMELPEYKFPSIKRAFFSMLDRGKAFIIKAGTIILICNGVIQLLQTFTWNFEVARVANDSILASIASPISLALIPLGFGMWQFAAAALTGFIAKENVVGTLAVCFSITNFINVDELALVGEANEVATILGITSVAALSYLVFNLFTPPCFAAIGAIHSEVDSLRWTFGAIAFQLSVGYTLSFVIYQVGTLITTGNLGNGFWGGLLVVITISSIIGYLMGKDKNPKAKVDKISKKKRQVA